MHGDIGFFCRAYTDQEKSPTSEGSKDELFRAGLGENLKMQIYHKMSFMMLFLVIFLICEWRTSFLKGRKGLAIIAISLFFGFVNISKGMPNSQQFKVLSLAVHKTPLALKQWVGLSRTCIQPPTDLHLNAEVENKCTYSTRTTESGRTRIKGGWPGQQYGRQIQKTQKPRERTKALLGVVWEVLAPKNTFTDNYEAP